MPLYNCDLCNYSTKFKADYKKHLNTKKHQGKINCQNSEISILGDIMLSGNRIFGHIKTSQGGHALTNKLLKKFFSDKTNWSFETYGNDIKDNSNSYENPVAISI